MAAAGNLPGTKLPATAVSGGVRTVGMLLRAAFILTLMAITVRVGLPQSETIWTARHPG